MADQIDEILKKRQGAEKPADDKPQADKFFSILAGDAIQTDFLEFQFANGVQTCFNYQGLHWFNYDPEAGFLDLEFNGYRVAVKGRGLRPLFDGVKNKRVAWVKEADTEMQDHKENESFVEELTITPPKVFEDEEEPAAEK